MGVVVGVDVFVGRWIGRRCDRDRGGGEVERIRK